MAVTKQELIEFLCEITSTASISVKENIEKKIRLLANEFETKFSCKLKEVDKSSYICVYGAILDFVISLPIVALAKAAYSADRHLDENQREAAGREAGDLNEN